MDDMQTDGRRRIWCFCGEPAIQCKSPRISSCRGSPWRNSKRIRATARRIQVRDRCVDDEKKKEVYTQETNRTSFCRLVLTVRSTTDCYGEELLPSPCRRREMTSMFNDHPPSRIDCLLVAFVCVPLRRRPLLLPLHRRRRRLLYHYYTL